ALLDRLEPERKLPDQIGIPERRDRTVRHCIGPAAATARQGKQDRDAGLDVDVSGLVEQRILAASIRAGPPLEHKPTSVLALVAHRDLDDRLTLRTYGNVDALGKPPGQHR